MRRSEICIPRTLTATFNSVACGSNRYSRDRLRSIARMTGSVRLDIDGAIATITNDNPEKHNAFDDDMDAQLFDILATIPSSVRAIVWRGEGKSFSSGRDVASIG